MSWHSRRRGLNSSKREAGGNQRKARGLTDRQAQRESEEQRLREVYGDNPAALAKATSALKNTPFCGGAASWKLDGRDEVRLGRWAESATDSFRRLKRGHADL